MTRTMKKPLLLCLSCLVALTMTQCVEDNDGASGDSTGWHIDTTDDGYYVDLGLLSMTMWKSANEVNPADTNNDFFTYDEAIATFGDKLPTKEQFEELWRSCQWKWLDIGCYKVTGPSGNFILLPAEGSRDCHGGVSYLRSYGFYWSSTPDGSEKAWYLNFYYREVCMYNYTRCYGNSVRLVKDVDDYK